MRQKIWEKKLEMDLHLSLSNMTHWSSLILLTKATISLPHGGPPNI